MAVVHLTKDNFNQTIEANDTVVIDFWAEWCGPCRAFKPVFEKAAARHPEITFASCNTEEEPELAAAFRIRSIPTLMVFRDKVLLYAEPGALPEEAFEELLTKVKEVDMAAVHAELAKREKAAAASS